MVDYLSTVSGRLLVDCILSTTRLLSLIDYSSTVSGRLLVDGGLFAQYVDTNVDESFLVFNMFHQRSQPVAQKPC